MKGMRFNTDKIEDKIHEVCYCYKYKLHYVLRKLTLSEVESLYIAFLRIESMLRGIELKLPNSKKLAEDKKKLAYRVGVKLG